MSEKSCFNCFYKRFGFLSYDDSPHEYTCRFSVDEPENIWIRALYLVDTDKKGWEEELKKQRCNNWRVIK
jgi:hypothetical protein